ncbi:Gfo/Idh/MocA family oxidoreductase [Microbacterium sp. NIBRBAC000506063]|uniref:Gfo/Idh/MocA family oxidoreductase n=1 Tax=Microbacterium sp. NIBRBAC000506063 TaxID=2734618 RepID=UPI002948C287|nr:Gfo/Idh/MocA family oxidoreductase [Microbacterium sp. NIBRBAC000506063]
MRASSRRRRASTAWSPPSLRLPLPPHGARGTRADRGGRARLPAHPRLRLPAGLDAPALRRRLARDLRRRGPSRAFADIGSHLCDLLEFVAGERIVRLVSQTRRVFEERGGHPVANEDAVSILVELESGAIGTLLVSQMAAGRKNSLTLEIHGTGASARFDQERPEELWIGQRDGSLHLFRDPGTAHAGSERFSRTPAGHAQGYQDAFNAFVADVYDAIDGGLPEGLPTFADGVRAVQLTEAVLQSARERRWVDIAPAAAPASSDQKGTH